MNSTHPLTEARAAELWEVHIPERKTHYLGWQTFPEPSRRCFTAILRAAFDAGREHEREHADPFHDPRPWQDCTRDDICAGDLVEARRGYMLYTGVAHHQSRRGNWYTEDGYPLSCDDAWPLRRIPAPTPPAEEVELPREHPAHLLDVELRNGDTCAYLAIDSDGDWIGVDQDGIMRAVVPNSLAAFALPDGTRARRDGDHEDGTPRFVKEAA